MGKGRMWAVGALVVVAICAALLWMDREDRVGPDLADEANTLEPDPDLLEARTREAPLLEGRAPAAEPRADAATRWTRLEAPGGNGTFVVRGVVMRGFNAAAPGARVIGSAYDGYEKGDKAVTRVALRADGGGWFQWPMKPPAGVTYLHFELVEPSTFYLEGTGTLIAPGQPPPPHVTLYMLPPDARIVGTVTDEKGNALPAAVILTSSRSKPIPCDAEGRYELPATSVTDDTSLTARAPGFAIQRATVAIRRADAVVTHDFKLAPEYRVFGRVTDPEGRPLAGAVVKSFGTSFWNKAVTDENGLYELGHLNGERSRLSVYARHSEYTESRADLKVTGRSQEVNLQLGRGSRVLGQVVDAEGRGLPGAQLYLGFSESAYNRLNARAKEEGRFEFPVVAPGSHTLAVEHHGLAPHKQRVTVPKEGGVAGLKITLRVGRRVAGRVVGEDGEPVSGMRLSLRHRDHYVGSSQRSDADGRFEIHSAPHDSVELWVFRVGFERLKQPLEGDSTDLRLVVRRAGRLAGLVLDDETGKPVPSFVIRFVEPDLAEGEKRGWDYGATWAKGHRFDGTRGLWDSGTENLPRGTIFGIEATAEGYAPAFDRHVVAVADPDPAATTLRLKRGATLSGLVRDKGTGKPVAGAVVRIAFGDNPHRDDPFEAWTAGVDPLRAKTDARGAFRIDSVRAGRAWIRVEHDDYAPVVRSVRVGDRAADAGTIRLGAGGTIRGRAADPESRPIPERAVMLMERIERPGGGSRAGRTRRTKTDAKGNFVFRKLPAGTYWVQLTMSLTSGRVVTAYSVSVELAEDGAAEVDLAPQGSGTIKGTVVVPRGAPESLVVSLYERDAAGRRSHLQRAAPLIEGAFTFAGVEPGTYSLSCGFFDASAGYQYRSGAAVVEVTHGATASVELKIN